MYAQSNIHKYNYIWIKKLQVNYINVKFLH